MKWILYFSLIFFVSCTKDNPKPSNESSIEGNWKMVLYIDSISGTSETKEQSPSPPADDVTMKISFDSTKISGNIVAKQINNSGFIPFTTMKENKFLHAFGTWTLGIEPPWGMYFFNCITAADSYSLPNDSTLHIQSPSKTLVFLRE